MHLPIHASWLNQIEIYFSIIQRKILAPNDFHDLDAVAYRLLTFERYWQDTGTPSDWDFTRTDLDDLLARIDTHEPLKLAARTDTSPHFRARALSLALRPGQGQVRTVRTRPRGDNEPGLGRDRWRWKVSLAEARGRGR